MKKKAKPKKESKAGMMGKKGRELSEDQLKKMSGGATSSRQVVTFKKRLS